MGIDTQAIGLLETRDAKALLGGVHTAENLSHGFLAEALAFPLAVDFSRQRSQVQAAFTVYVLTGCHHLRDPDAEQSILFCVRFAGLASL